MRRLSRLFPAAGAGHLRWEFDERTGQYADNVVVLAVPAPGG